MLGHNLVNHVMTELEVSCLPSDLPEFIEVDLSGLSPKATLHVNDIKLPKGVRYVSLGKNNPRDRVPPAAAGRRRSGDRPPMAPRPRRLPMPRRPQRRRPRPPMRRRLPRRSDRGCALTDGPPRAGRFPLGARRDNPALKLFVGLGNPGPEYEATRHNAGFWWLDALARDLKVPLLPERGYHGFAGRANVGGHSVWLLEPQTFMNLSGKSVAALARFFKIAPDEILVVHDELDVLPGQAKLKFGGSHAGHNGLRDIHAQLGTGDYWRLRLASGTRATRTRWSAGCCASRSRSSARRSRTRSCAPCTRYLRWRPARWTRPPC